MRQKLSEKKKLASMLFFDVRLVINRIPFVAKEQTSNSLSLEPILSNLSVVSSSTVWMQKERHRSISLKTSWLDLPSHICSQGLHTLHMCIEEYMEIIFDRDYKSVNYIHRVMTQ